MKTVDAKIVTKMDLMGTPVRVVMSLYENATDGEKLAWETFHAQVAENMNMSTSFSVKNEPYEKEKTKTASRHEAKETPDDRT